MATIKLPQFIEVYIWRYTFSRYLRKEYKRSQQTRRALKKLSLDTRKVDERIKQLENAHKLVKFPWGEQLNRKAMQ